MKEIKLKNSTKIALIDDEFFPILGWRTWSKTNFGHAVTNIDGVVTFMHRLILNTDLPEIDHIDGDGLNNQLSNLRGATRSQNLANRRKMANPALSQYKGVSKSRDKWRATIKKDGKKYEIGCFKTEKLAAHAWDRKAKELYGEFARLNFSEILIIQSIDRKVS